MSPRRRCQCSHPYADHAGACTRPGCGCSRYRVTAPAVAAVPPRVVPGRVLREIGTGRAEVAAP